MGFDKGTINAHVLLLLLIVLLLNPMPIAAIIHLFSARRIFFGLTVHEMEMYSYSRFCAENAQLSLKSVWLCGIVCEHVFI